MFNKFANIGRRLAISALRQTRKSTNVFVKGVTPIPLNELISPLRYDILIRKKYFSFFRSHIEIYRSNFPKYLELAYQQPYYVWFRDVACFRFDPDLLYNREALNKAFVDRIHRSAELFNSFEKHGLNPVGLSESPPIALHSARRVLPTESSKFVRRDFYAGDGCHRLALLLLFEYQILEPESYVVRIHDEFSPLDNTSILIRKMPVSECEYSAFLSLGYGQFEFADLASLLRHIRKTQPRAAHELERIIELDAPYLVSQ